MFIAGAYFFVYAAQFLSCSLRQKHPLLDVNPVGSTFNIQNSIPHKSQKPKAVAEINRPIEFQRGTAGVPESAKEGVRVLAEGSDIGLGPGDRAFEPHYSDHNWTPVLIQCVSKRVSSFFLQKPLFARVFIYLLTKAGSAVTQKRVS